MVMGEKSYFNEKDRDAVLRLLVYFHGLGSLMSLEKLDEFRKK